MEQNELRVWESRCIQEEMPLCRAACPLQMDVRAFMEAVPAGAASARRLLERHLPLPGFFALICDHPAKRPAFARNWADRLLSVVWKPGARREQSVRPVRFPSPAKAKVSLSSVMGLPRLPPPGSGAQGVFCCHVSWERAPRRGNA